MAIFQYSLTITLAEDLHSGSGLGGLIIDAYQSTDKKGAPVVWRQHFKGLLKDAAEAYVDALTKVLPENSIASEQQCFAALFEGNQHVELISGSLYFNDLGEPGSPFINWQSSARVNGDSFNRSPQEGSLRRVEYVKAGSQFKAQMWLITSEQSDNGSTEDIPTNDALHEFLLTSINRVSHIGAKRNRGAGAITLSLEAEKVTLPSTPQCDNTNRSETKSTLKIKMNNLEPLRLPDDQKAGNTIATSTYLSGIKLKSALANSARLLGYHALFDALLSKQIEVSYAYPLPEDVSNADVIPMPKHLQYAKAKAASDLKNVPWWFAGTEQQGVIDKFQASDNVKTKRANSNEYLVIKRDDQQHLIYQQQTSVQMRNKVLSKRAQHATNKQELFSEEVVPEQQTFMFSVKCPTALLTQLDSFLNILRKHTIPLLLGRGKAPSIIKSVTKNTAPNVLNSDEQQSDQCTIVFGSPLLTYNRITLQPETDIDIDTLLALTGLEPTLNNNLQIKDSAFETSQLVGFNFATQLPKKVSTCIAAGSSLLVTGSKEAISELTQALQKLSGLGEQLENGLGRFYYYSGSLAASRYTKEG